MARRKIYKTTTIASAKALVAQTRSTQKKGPEAAVRVRVLVVDDHAIMRQAICELLSHDPTLDVICQTASGEEAVSKAEELQPDLVLLVFRASAGSRLRSRYEESRHNLTSFS